MLCHAKRFPLRLTIRGVLLACERARLYVPGTTQLDFGLSPILSRNWRLTTTDVQLKLTSDQYRCSAETDTWLRPMSSRNWHLTDNWLRPILSRNWSSDWHRRSIETDVKLYCNVGYYITLVLLVGYITLVLRHGNGYRESWPLAHGVNAQ